VSNATPGLLAAPQSVPRIVGPCVVWHRLLVPGKQLVISSLRTHASIIPHPPCSLDTPHHTPPPPGTRDRQLLLRGRLLRENGNYLPKESFYSRKAYFNDKEKGCFQKVMLKHKDTAPPNPMTGTAPLSSLRHP